MCDRQVAIGDKAEKLKRKVDLEEEEREKDSHWVSAGDFAIC